MIPTPKNSNIQGASQPKRLVPAPLVDIEHSRNTENVFLGGDDWHSLICQVVVASLPNYTPKAKQVPITPTIFQCPHQTIVNNQQINRSTFHRLTTSPPRHFATSPPHHLTTSPPHHIATLPPHHLATSPPRHLATSPPRHIATSLLYTFVILLLCLNATAQPTTDPNAVDYYTDQVLQYTDFVYNPQVRSVQLHLLNEPLSYPIIPLNGRSTLDLFFDELGTNRTNYSYKLIHCNATWQPSNLDPFDFTDGFTTDDITNFSFSNGTLQPYTQYHLQIPNSYMRPTKSGNYLLVVFESGNEKALALTRRFMVYEDITQINANWLTGGARATTDTHQRISFTINYDPNKITNPIDELHVNVLQNGRWDNAVLDLPPLFMGNTTLNYDYLDKTLFAAGNEFRPLDIRSFLLRSEQARKFDTINNQKHIYLRPDNIRRQGYSRFRLSNFDYNGKFYTGSTDNRFKFIDADYAYVHFSLPFDQAITNGNMYIMGGLTNWQILPEYQLHYQVQQKTYETSILLKQGLYDYQYVIVSDGKPNIADHSLIEGNYTSTENDYQILVYQRSWTDRYDRLVGYKLFNTLR